MSDSIWDILGLYGPSDDLKVIKKAYAKKLRVTRPDEDPSGFMALREALENAKHYAHYNQPYPMDEPAKEDGDIIQASPQTFDKAAKEPIALYESEAEEAMDYLPIEADAVVPESHIPIATIEGLHSETDEKTVIQKVQSLLKDPFGRADAGSWLSIFDDSKLDGIDEIIDFEENFRSFLLDEFGYYDGETKQHNLNRNPKLISTQIGTLIFNRMGWRDVRGRPFYVQDQIEWLRQDLDVINRSKHPLESPSTPATITENVTGWSHAWTFVIVIFGLIALARIAGQSI